MGIFIVVLIIGIIGFYISSNVTKIRKRKKQLDSILNSTDDFTASLTVNNYDGRYLFSVDDQRKKILYIDDEGIKHLLDFENIISVEVMEDSDITYSKSTTRTIGGGIIGGIIGGGAGAIVGGLSGSSKGKKKVTEIKIKILLRNYYTSTIYIDCLNIDGSVEKDSLIYKLANEEAWKIADKLSVAIDAVDREEKSQQANSVEHSPSSKPSIADELEKLYSLKEKGIISDEEFTKLKEKLMQ